MDEEEDRKASAQQFLRANSYLLLLCMKASDSQKKKKQTNHATCIAAVQSGTATGMPLLPYCGCTNNYCIDMYNLDIVIFG